MKRISKTDYLPDDLSELAEPLLSLEEQLEDVEFELTKQISVDGADTDILLLSPPNAHMILQAGKVKRDEDKIFVLLSKYCNCPPTDLHQLHTRDLRRLNIVIDAFTQ